MQCNVISFGLISLLWQTNLCYQCGGSPQTPDSWYIAKYREVYLAVMVSISIVWNLWQGLECNRHLFVWKKSRTASWNFRKHAHHHYPEVTGLFCQPFLSNAQLQLLLLKLIHLTIPTIHPLSYCRLQGSGGLKVRAVSFTARCECL